MLLVVSCCIMYAFVWALLKTSLLTDAVFPFNSIQCTLHNVVRKCILLLLLKPVLLATLLCSVSSRKTVLSITIVSVIKLSQTSF